jgi:hypothetical protein
MPRITFGDIEGKLEVLRVDQVRAQGPLQRPKLIAKDGCKGNMSAWVRDLKGDCPSRIAHSLLERCGVPLGRHVGPRHDQNFDHCRGVLSRFCERAA